MSWLAQFVSRRHTLLFSRISGSAHSYTTSKPIWLRLDSRTWLETKELLRFSLTWWTPLCASSMCTYIRVSTVSRNATQTSSKSWDNSFTIGWRAVLPPRIEFKSCRKRPNCPTWYSLWAISTIVSTASSHQSCKPWGKTDMTCWSTLTSSWWKGRLATCPSFSKRVISRSHLLSNARNLIILATAWKEIHRGPIEFYTTVSAMSRLAVCNSWVTIQTTCLTCLITGLSSLNSFWT